MTAKVETFQEFPDRSFCTFMGRYLGTTVGGITLTTNQERKKVGPANLPYKTRIKQLTEEHSISLEVAGVAPHNLALMLGQASVPPMQTLTDPDQMPNPSASGVVQHVQHGLIPVETTVGLTLKTGVVTSTVRVYNQDMVEQSFTSDQFPTSDYTVSGVYIYHNGVNMSGNYPGLMLYDYNDANAKRVDVGGRTGVAVGSLKVFFALDGNKGLGIECYRAAPMLESISMTGSPDSDEMRSTVTFDLLGDQTKPVGSNIWRLVRGGFA